MKTKIYLLQHSYQYGENNEYDEVKVLGIFSSKLAAKKAIEFYKEGKYDFEMILVTVQGEVFASKNLSVRLNLNEHAVEINKEKMTIIK